MAGSVKVDPRDQTAPRFLVQFDAFMPGLQMLDQLAGVGVIFSGLQQRDIIAHVDAADIGQQRFVGWRVANPAAEFFLVDGMQTGQVKPSRNSPGIVRHLLLGSQVDLMILIVTTNAVAVEHRLNFAGKVEPAGRTVPRLQHTRRLYRCNGLTGIRNIPAGLVASDARHDLAGHRRNPASHKLHGLTLGIQGLECNRSIGRDPENSRAVLLQRCGAENSHSLPRTGKPDLIHTRKTGIPEIVGDHTQAFNGAARNVFQSRPGIDVLNKSDGIAAFSIDAVGQDWRDFAFDQRNRL